MTTKRGYIYIRENPGLENKTICKLGQTMNVPERESTYITSEPDGGYFTHVFEIVNCNIKNMDQYIRNIEQELQKEFHKYHYKSKNKKSGKEWYYKNIQIEIEKELQKMQNRLKSVFTYRKLTQDEILELERLKHELEGLGLESELLFKDDENIITPFEFQENIINKSLEYFTPFLI